MFDDKIYYNNDIIRAYSDRRKALSEEDVEDLLKCLVKFLQKDSKKTDGYAYKIPFIGVLHKKMGNDTLKQSQEDSMWMEYYYEPIKKRNFHPLFKETVSRLYPNMTNKEIQDYQNGRED